MPLESPAEPRNVGRGNDALSSDFSKRFALSGYGYRDNCIAIFCATRPLSSYRLYLGCTYTSCT